MFKYYCIKCGREFSSKVKEEAFCDICKEKTEIVEDFPIAQPNENRVEPEGIEAPFKWNIGDVILDLYEVKDIYKGGMGLVYRVRHRGWNIDLVVKTPREDILKTEEQKENFIREAETWINLGFHPHIVSCYYLRKFGKIPCIFAEYVDGGSLKDWIRDGRLYEGGLERTLERILDISIQFAWGLHYAHEQGLVHQDVKPANVMITSNGVAKVTDFGLARSTMMSCENAGLRENGLVSCVGMTAEYCSPEQATGRKLNHKTDIWSWAVSVLEMFIGERTWMAGEIAGQVLEEYLNKGSGKTFIPDMPDDLVVLLRECFELEIEKRPKSLDEIANRLKTIYEKEVGKVYSREKPKSEELRADSLNNRALSLLDLGQEANAISYWEEALRVDPIHLESFINLRCWQKRNGAIGDFECVAKLQEIAIPYQTYRLYWEWMLQFHLERGDEEEIQNILTNHLRNPSDYLLQQIQNENRPNIKFYRLLSGHHGFISSIQFSPDGRYLASSSNDKTVRIWDVSTGKELVTLSKHQWGVNSVAFSSDGRLLASGGGDCIIIVWDLGNAAPVAFLEGHTGDINAILFTLDGKHIVSSSDDRTIRIWDIASKQQVGCLKGHRESVTSIAICPSEPNLLVSGSRDKSVKVWNLRSKDEIVTLNGHTDAVFSVIWLEDGHNIASGGKDLVIRVWDWKSQKEFKHLEGHTDSVFALSLFSKNVLLSTGCDGTIRFWQIPSSKEVLAISTKFDERLPNFSLKENIQALINPKWVTAMSVSDKSNLLGAASTFGIIGLWKFSGNFLSPIVKAPFPLVSRPKHSGEIAESQRIKHKILSDARDLIAEKKYSEAYSLLIKGRSEPSYRRDKEILSLLDEISIYATKLNISDIWPYAEMRTEQWVYSNSFSPLSNKVCCACSDGSIRIFDLKKSSSQQIKAHNGPAFTVSFAPDGERIASGGHDKVVRIWNLKSFTQSHFYEHPHWVFSVAFSPNGNWLATACADGNIRIWDIESNTVKLLRGHTGDVNSVVFSKDGSLLASGSSDGTVRLWSMPAGKELDCLNLRSADVNGVAFSADGQFITAVTSQGVVCLYNIIKSKLRKWRMFAGEIWGISFSGHPEWCFAIGCADGRICFLKTNGSVFKEISAHKNNIRSLSFSPDGNYLASCGKDGTLIIWRLEWECNFQNLN